MKRTAGLMLALALLLSVSGCAMSETRSEEEPSVPSAADVAEADVDEGPGYPIVHIVGVTLPEEYGDGFLNCEAAFWIVNYLREKEGLEPLRRCDTTLQAATVQRLEESIELFSHTRPNGERFSSVLAENGIECTYVNENLACGQFTAEHVVHDWLCSDSHRANLFNPDIERVCIACRMDGDGVPYWAFEGVRYSEPVPKPEGYVQPSYAQYADVSTTDVTPTDVSPTDGGAE